jgi:hypothetical protein
MRAATGETVPAAGAAASTARRGGILRKALVLVAVLAVLVSALYYALIQVRISRQCEARLLRIYRALQLYELDRGTLPSLAYFPDNPKDDADSLCVVLEGYGTQPDTCICGGAPRVLREQGLTYVWNTALSGRKMPGESEPLWMLVDVAAVSPDVPAPHAGYYNVLYSDGVVRRTRFPLKELRGL